MGVRREWVLLALWLLVPLWLPAATQDVWSGVERIVAIGDVHGDYQQFVTMLRMAGLIDENQKWIAGKAHLVQTGDVPDRGPDTRKVMDLLMRLEKEAIKAGGWVHPLIGNHEAMNIYGDLRYVVPGEFEAFRENNSERQRELMYQQHIDNLRKSDGPMPKVDASYRKDWESKHPLGYIEHRMAWAPQGTYGKWIKKHNAIVKINDTVFLHGGIGPKYANQMIQKMNDRIRDEIEDTRLLQNGVSIDPDGPLWYRGLAQGDETAAAHVDTVLRNMGVQRIVIGHTVTAGTVTPRYGGKVVLIDNGMAEAYGSRQACLVIEGGKAHTLHRGQKLELPVNNGSALLEYFKQAAALDPQPSPLAAAIRQLEEKLMSVK